MAIELVAHASGSSVESRGADMQAVTENLQSANVDDRIYATRQISIWLMQKSAQTQDFVDQGYMDLIVDCLKASDDDTPSSSTTPDAALPCATLLHEFAQEGKKCQDAIAFSGGIPCLIDLLVMERSTPCEEAIAVEAASALCLIAVGSEEGRKEILLNGGLPAIIQCLGEKNSIEIRQQAAGAVMGLATEKKERQAAILEARGMEPLINLLNAEPDAEDKEAQLAALNAATALRRLCDAASATAEFCRSGGLEVVVSRIVNDEPADRERLRLPMPVAPSTVRAECKQLLGDVYVSSEPVYQEKIVQVLEKHNITIDRITTTPTAYDQRLEGKDSMEKGHKVLSCRTSMPTSKIPEIKLHLKRAIKPKAAKNATAVAASAATSSQAVERVMSQQPADNLVNRTLATFVRNRNSMRPHLHSREAVHIFCLEVPGIRQSQALKRRKWRCRRLQALHQQAVRKTLTGLPIHELGSGRFTVPVLETGEGGLPFSMSLDLYRGLTDVPRSEVSSRPQQGIFSLHYILEGSGQLVESHGRTKGIQSGDSILAPHGHTYIQVPTEDPQEASLSSEWSMASLTLLLPKDLLGPKPGNPEHHTRDTLASASLGITERHSIRRLSKVEAAKIVAGAQASAQAATIRQRALTDSTEMSHRPAERSDEGQQVARRVFKQRNDPLVASAKIAEASEEEFEPRMETGQGGAAGAEATARVDLTTASLDPPQSHLSSSDLGESHQPRSSVEEAESRQGALDSLRAFLKRLARWRQNAAAGSAEVLKRSLSELSAFRLPHQTNRLALVFDPLGYHVNFTFGVEIFEAGHKTTPHVHQHAHELFFILAGEGEGFCDGERFPLEAGDVVVFPPGTIHGVDVSPGGKMYCLEVMQPNDMFAELVRAGMPAGALMDDDLCILIATGCA